MGNNYFRFKKFMVYQDKCSMKVCTDACIFGAWLTQKSITGKWDIAHCLDIGTGTGLLSLMYAQKNLKAIIDAVEIEENAGIQAKENFLSSAWSNRLKIHHTDIKKFVSDKKYELIISNPPFYENELSTNEKNKNIAKHDAGLRLENLMGVIKKHLAPAGRFAILLPLHRIEYFEDLAAENNFFPQEKLLVRQTPKHNFFRCGMIFSQNKTELKPAELIIKNNNDYTNELIELMKDYYLDNAFASIASVK